MHKFAFTCFALVCWGCVSPAEMEPGADASLDPDPRSSAAADAGAGTAPYGGDGGGADTAPSANLELIARCGSPPYLKLRLVARNVMAPPTARELAGVAITFKHCPGTQVLTGNEGSASVYITENAETWIRFDAPGFLPWLFGEIAVTESTSAPSIVATMLPADLGPVVLPGYQPDRPLVYVQVQNGRSAGPEACLSRDGVALALKEQPQVSVLYRNPGSTPTYSLAASTSTEGVAVVEGIDATLAAVTLVATKPGCSYVPSYGDADAATLVPIVRTPLQKGAVTYQTINPVR
jgi:hypothetical protein